MSSALLATALVVPFEQLRMSDVEVVGGKNASLGEMISQLAAGGVRVPGGFATTARAFREFLAHDDGQSSRNLDIADVILVGVSRCGKTPTSLYLAMQHGIKAANCPLIPEDFERGRLPGTLAAHKSKCFGLTIEPDRLAQVRHERRPGSAYASLLNCRYEVNAAEALMRREGIGWLSSTHKSIEEIATTILRAPAPKPGPNLRLVHPQARVSVA